VGIDKLKMASSCIVLSIVKVRHSCDDERPGGRQEFPE
jgi:hypothetical protein